MPKMIEILAFKRAKLFYEIKNRRHQNLTIKFHFYEIDPGVVNQGFPMLESMTFLDHNCQKNIYIFSLTHSIFSSSKKPKYKNVKNN